MRFVAKMSVAVLFVIENFLGIVIKKFQCGHRMMMTSNLETPIRNYSKNTLSRMFLLYSLFSEHKVTIVCKLRPNVSDYE